MSLNSGQKLGPYEILARVGAGGMGEVYKAMDTRLHRAVAIKVLPAHLSSDTERRERFEREARAASALNHPNITTIYDIHLRHVSAEASAEAEGYGGQVGEDEDVDYIVMEYVEGKTFRELLGEGPLSAKTMLPLASQVADGLAKAHVAGIVHRDLKPENLMVTGDGLVKILDFGLAKLMPQSSEMDSETATVTKATQAGTVLGTVQYMSPEQAAGRPLDYRADQFSFGSILYEMATGSLAFKKDTVPQTLAAIIEAEPEPIRKVNDKVPIKLSTIVERCLAKDPGRRYDSTSELAEEIKTVSEASPIGRARRRVLWSAAGLLAFVLAFALGLNLERLGSMMLDTTRLPIGSIAVLPLENLSGDPEQEYFADGMTEALITDLAKLGALKVIARSSTRRYVGTNKPLAEIAGELGVDAVVEGSAVRVGDRVRITAQLIDAKTERALWADSYERDLKSALILQSDVAQAIAQEIGIAVTPTAEERLETKRAVNPETYEAYLRGMFYLSQSTPEGIQKGMTHLREAVEKDPADPFAYAGLALGYATIGHSAGSPKEAFPRAKAAALRALELDETLAEAHLALADVKLYHDWDWPGAEKAFLRALELNPSLPWAHYHYGWYLDLMGRLDEAEAEMKRAKELDPLSPLFTAWLGGWYRNQERYEEALYEARQALELNPDFPIGNMVLGWVLAHEGRYDEAIAVHQKMAAAVPAWRSILGRTYVEAGREDDARKILADWRKEAKPADSLQLAGLCAVLGEKDEAFEWLEVAYAERAAFFPWIVNNPLVEGLRDDPRFHDLLRRLNL